MRPCGSAAARQRLENADASCRGTHASACSAFSRRRPGWRASGGVVQPRRSTLVRAGRVRGVLVVRATADQSRPPPSSSPRVQAALFTGSYAVIFGLALTLAPQSVFGLLFASETVSSGWIRVGGILFALIGCQYLGTAAGERQGLGALGFYRATIWSRVALAAAFGLLVALRQSPPGLLVLAAVNLVGAASMHLALRRSSGGGGGAGGGGVGSVAAGGEPDGGWPQTPVVRA